MRVTVKTPDFQDTTLRPFTPPANESKRAKSSWMGIARKPLLVETSTPGVYDRFDFSSAPFSCVNDFLEEACRMDFGWNPKSFKVRYDTGSEVHDLPVSVSYCGDYTTAADGTLPGSGTVKIFNDLTINHNVSTGCAFLVCNNLTIATGRTVTGGGGVSFPYSFLKLSDYAIVRSENCGSGGASAGQSSGPCALQGKPGENASPSGVYLGSGGGGSGGVYAHIVETWGNTNNENPGGGGGIFGGGGGSWAWCLSRPYDMPPEYFNVNTWINHISGGGGGGSLFVYANSFDSRGTLTSNGGGQSTGGKWYAEPPDHVSTGAGGGGVIVVHTKNLIRQGGFQCNGGTVTSSTINAYGGKGGNGSYKVVTL